MKSVEELQALGARIVYAAKKAGADVAEVLSSSSEELSTRIRLRERELIEEAGSHTVGLRVIKDDKSAATYTSDTTDAGLDALVADAMELAALSQPDPLAAPPDPALLAKSFEELELFDPSGAEIDAKRAAELALAAEVAALDYDERITNSEGASYARTRSAMALVTSGGFSGGYQGTYQSLSVSPLADDADGKKRTAYDWDARRYVEAMRAPKDVGEEAARRTLAKLGAKKVPSQEVPVVFHPDAGRALLSLLFSCIDGRAVYQRSSYLCDREGEAIASPLVTIVDDPLLLRGPGSKPFDGEGLAARKNVVVEGGVLRTYLMDSYAARKLGKESTASASRGYNGRPSVAPTNFHLLAGETDPDAIVSDVKAGLYVTSMMGFGFSAVTGDFSRGAEGFWIEDGEKKFPVGEITISLNFDALWKGIDAVGNDLDAKARYATPTFRVKKMTVAGS